MLTPPSHLLDPPISRDRRVAIRFNIIFTLKLTVRCIFSECKNLPSYYIWSNFPQIGHYDVTENENIDFLKMDGIMSKSFLTNSSRVYHNFLIFTQI